MKGFIKLDAVERGIKVEAHLEDVSSLDKARLVNAVVKTLNMDEAEWRAFVVFREMGLFNTKVEHSDGDFEARVDVGAIKKAMEGLKNE